MKCIDKTPVINKIINLGIFILIGIFIYHFVYLLIINSQLKKEKIYLIKKNEKMGQELDFSQNQINFMKNRIKSNQIYIDNLILKIKQFKEKTKMMRVMLNNANSKLNCIIREKQSKKFQ